MAFEILLARHGETDWNLEGRWQGHTDMPLNSRGMEQAYYLGRMLRNSGIDRIYSSDLSRAKSTAEIVGREIGVSEVSSDRRLRERYLGSFEGLTSAEIRKELGVEDKNLSIVDIGMNPSIEKWEDFMSRILTALESIRSANEKERCLVVAHGGVMMAVSLQMMDGYEASRRFTNGELIHLTYGGKWKAALPEGSAIS